MDINKLLEELTIEEKCSLLVGKDGWRTKDIERLGIPSLFMADGPHGLRKVIDSSSVHESTDVAVCYPSLVTLASSFDSKLGGLMGESIAREFKAKGVNLILGPGINIKRHPFCGRNFEYFSEDPLVTIKMAKGFIEGAKSLGVGTCIKHYALNSQEDYRMTSNSIADERAKYEIYYKAFMELVKLEPEMVMCSYNKVDDVYASENIHHLKEVLRDEFGFKGVIVSDWSAVNNRTDALIASLDLEMPGYIYGVHKLIKDYKKGILPLKDLNDSVRRILEMIEKFNDYEKISVDLEKHHLISSQIAAESMVLLKNEEKMLPISKLEKILLVGDMAKHVRYQGGGSSHINAYKVDSIYDELIKHDNINFTRGYDSKSLEVNQELLEELKILAPNYNKVIIACGLTDEFESEGYDRTHLSIPQNQEFIINQVANLNQNVILVLQIGSPIVMPYIDKVKGIINCYLGGEGIGKALEKVLFGEVNPSGRLAETFPLKHNDVPSDKFFATGNNNVFYQESIYVGYRYYKTNNLEVLFPFGYGESYSHFEYSNMMINKKSLKKEQTITISVDVTNNGPYDGKEVVLLFFEPKNPNMPRPKRELIDFDKVMIKNGETKNVKFKINVEAFNYYHPELKKFVVDDGIYNLQICKNARDILIEEPISLELGNQYPKSIWHDLESYKPIKGLTFETKDYELLIKREVCCQSLKYAKPYTINNNLEDMENSWIGRFLYKKLEEKARENANMQDEQFVRMMMASIKQMPLRALALLSNGELRMNMVIGFVALANGNIFKAIKYLFKKD